MVNKLIDFDYITENITLEITRFDKSRINSIILRFSLSSIRISKLYISIKTEAKKSVINSRTGRNSRGRIYGRFGSELVIEVGDVIFTFQLRHEWWSLFSLKNLIPLDSSKESMLLDGKSISISVSKSLLHISVEKLLENILGVWGQIVLELEFALEDPVSDGLPVVAGEGRSSSQHIMNQDTETPPVHLLTMPATN